MASVNPSRNECLLRWTEHQTLMQGVYTDLLASERFADVTLYCGDDHAGLKCHRFILSACSSYFGRIFSQESPISSPQHSQVAVVLKDVCRDSMEALLHFIYRGELTIQEVRLAAVVDLARSLGVKGIGDPAIEVNCEDSIPTPKKLSKPTNNNGRSLPNHHQQSFGPCDEDVEDYDLDENDVEFEFETESLTADNQPVFVDMADEGNMRGDSEAGGSSCDDVSMSSSLNTTAVRRRRKSMAVYKRYSDDNLQAAMRLVVEGGAKTADASVKFGIPFTTLSRKLRIYKESMGFCGSSSSSTSGLIKSPANKKFKKEEEEIVVEPPVQEEEEEEEEEEIEQLASGQEEEEEEEELVIERVDNNATETGRRMRRRTAGAALVESLCSRQYKAYTDEQLRDAMAAVQNGQMRLAEACNHFGIPITTLGRKIRTSTTTTSMATTTNGDEGK